MRLFGARGPVAVLFVLAAAGCTPTAGPTLAPSRFPPLAGTNWTLVSINGAVPAPGEPVTMSFDLAGVSGIGPCNLYNGGYVLDPSGAIRISDLISTKRACVGQARGALETALFAALRTIDAASVGEDGRLVMNGSGARLVWSP